MRKLKLFFACLLMAVLSIGQMWGAVTALSLPHSWDANDGKSAYTDALGCTLTSISTDYGSAPKLKFNAAGSTLLIQVADAPDEISFTFKQNGTNAGTFKVQESADGSTFTDALTVTWPGNGKTSTPSTSLNSSTRYIKLVYVTKGNSTNAGIGGVSITKASGGSTACATPTFSPAAGVYNTVQNVTISCETTDATIYYTTNGNDPTTSSDVYTSPIAVSSAMTIKALAVKSGLSNSAASAKYAFTENAGTEANPYTVADAKIVIDAIGTKSDAYVTGTISQVDSYNSTYHSITYWISDDGTTTNQFEVYGGKGLNGADFTKKEDLSVGDQVVVKGNLKKFNSTYEFDTNSQLVSLDHPTSDAGVITATPASVEVAAAGEDNGSIAVSYTGISDMDNVDDEVYLYNDEEHTSAFTGGWLTAAWNGDKSAVEYLVDANTGAARTAYIYLFAIDDNGDDVEKVIEVSQAKYSVDYAELPFAFDGGRADIDDVDGMTQDGLDTDYSDSPKLKFKTAGTSVVIKINADPGTLTYDIKGNSFSGGTFDVLQSSNGTNYTSVASYTELGAVQSESKTLDKETRYVKFVYTEKVNGNVALGNIAISEYVAPTACEAPTFTPGTGETFTETLDVVLTSATPGATIYYTLDESEPTTASSVFGEKITLTETTTVNAIAVKEGLTTSSVASATFTKVLIIDSYDIDFETNDLAPYVNWNFNNIALASTAITAHGGTYYGNTDGKGSASITTKEKYANPGTLTFYISKESNNTTASSWIAQVSEDGTAWTDVDPSFDAKVMAKGEWNKCEADLSAYTNVYVRIAYSGSTAIRAIDDISLEPAAPVKKPVISDEESFLTSAEVSITCGTTGATIYYTTDGSDPKSGSEYSSSFTLTETATVRAIANLGEDWSTEAESKTFTKISVVDVATALSASVNDEVYVQGTITSITEVNLNFSNATYVISDMSAGLPQNEMIVYRGKYVDGAGFDSEDQIHVGDVVVVSGTIGVYQEKNQLAQGNQIESITPAAVVAPVFSPDGGGFMGEASVTITSATEGAIVYYTLDGTTPSNASLTAQPIVLTATTTIKAIAIKDEENSMVVAKTFTLSAPMTVAAACAALDSEDPINNAAVSGIVYQVDNISGGKATYWISDDGTDAGDKLEVYNGSGLNGADFAANGIQIGDEVTVFGNLTIYKGTKEFAAGSRLLAFNRPVFAVTGVEVDETATVKVNKTVQLTANVLPVNATNKNVTWSVKAGSEAYAEVSATGLVTGKAEGIAIIVVTTEDGGFTDECTVTVTPGPPANTDILTAEEIGVGSSYDDWSGNGFGTSSVYAGNSMTATGDNAGAIQLRSKDNSGIVLTASNGLYLKNLSVTVKSGSNTLNIYAKNSAYTSTADLYNEEKRGTLIGTVSATGAMTLEEGISYNDNYQYIGMRSANGAIYLDNITITWGYGAYQRGELTANRYGTICLPNNGTIANAKLYDIDYYDGANTLYLLEVNGNAVEAGHPYIFLPSATTIEVTYTDNAGEDAGSYRGLVGSYTQETVAIGTGDEANYILYNNAYYLVNSLAYVGENRAYIHMASVPTTPYQQQGAPRRRVAMNVYSEQTTTDIDALNASEAPVKMIIDGQLFIIRGEKMYNVNGQVVK